MFHNLGVIIWGEELLGKNLGRTIFGLCVKQGEMLPIFLRIAGAMMSRFICTHSMLVIWGEEHLGKNSWGIFLGPLVSSSVKQGEMLPIFLRIAGAMMSRFMRTHSMLIIFGEELLGKTFWGWIVGAIGIFVCKTGRNVAHVSQHWWGHDVKICLPPFDVNNLGGRTFAK